METKHFLERIKSHKRQSMVFDDVKLVNYPEDKLDEMERVWIQYFKPILNSDLKHEKKYKSKQIVKSYKRMRFRKLTEKSFLDFGANRDLTVEQYLKMDKKLDLAKIYYSLSHITFFDNILELIGITEEWRIKKPGVDYDKYYEFSMAIYPGKVKIKQSTQKRYFHHASKRALKNLALRNNSKAYHRQFNQKS